MNQEDPPGGGPDSDGWSLLLIPLLFIAAATLALVLPDPPTWTRP